MRIHINSAASIFRTLVEVVCAQKLGDNHGALPAPFRLMIAIGATVWIGWSATSDCQVVFPRWKEAAIPDDAFVPPGREPTGLAWDEREGLFWVADRASSKVFGVDPSSRNSKGDVEIRRTIDLSGTKGAALAQLARDPDPSRPYLWIADQATWSVWLVNTETEKRLLEMSLPETGLSRDVEISGITLDPFHGTLWVCYSAGHCSKLLEVRTPDPPSDDGLVATAAEVITSVFPRSDPRGLAWVTDQSNQGGCLWSLAFNGDDFPARQTLRSLFPTGRKDRTNSIVDSMVFLDLVPWRNPSSLTVKGDFLWGAFDGDPITDRRPLVLPLRPLSVSCLCDSEDLTR